jgi:hypothetical protein
MGSLTQPTLSTLAQSSRRAEGSPQVREMAARPLLRWTVRPSDRRGLSLPYPTNLDRPARRSIETDSAFHRMSQINRALLHVSRSARPESCWSAARHAQRRRFATGLRPGKAHIRKAYPRDDTGTLADQIGEVTTQTHRLLRRGIPYGDPFTRRPIPHKRRILETAAWSSRVIKRPSSDSSNS